MGHWYTIHEACPHLVAKKLRVMVCVRVCVCGEGGSSLMLWHLARKENQKYLHVRHLHP